MVGDAKGSPPVAPEIHRLRELFPDAATRPLVMGDASQPTKISDAARALVHHLRTPILLCDLIEVTEGTELDTLTALAELEHAGRLRRLSSTLDAVPLASPDQRERLRMMAVLGLRRGFDSRVRVVFAGAQGRLSILAHALLCIEGAKAPPEGVPAVPMPHTVARIALGTSSAQEQGVDLELVSLPLVPAYAPLWPMALAGTAVVVRLDEAAGSLLDEACEAAGTKVVDAHMLVGPYDEANVGEVAVLVRASLEA